MPWFFFLNSVNSGTMSLITYRNIVTKTYFPREIIPFAQVCSRLLDFFAAAAMFAGLMVYNRIGLTRWALHGAGGVRAARPVHHGRDADHVVGQRLLSRRQPGRADRAAALAVRHAGRVSAAAVSSRSGAPGSSLNPLTGIVEGFHSALVYGREPDWPVLGISAAFTVACLRRRLRVVQEDSIAILPMSSSRSHAHV